MTIEETCAVTYALLLERLEATAASERIVAAVLIAGGAKGVAMPDPARLRRDLDAALLETAKVADSDEQALRDALGVR